MIFFDYRLLIYLLAAIGLYEPQLVASHYSKN